MESERMDELYFVQNLVEQVRRATEEADSFKQECAEVGKRCEQLTDVLRTATRVGPGNLYARPAKAIFADLRKSLEKALALLRKCKRSGILKRVITITSGADFKKVNYLLDNSIGDVTWLLNVSAVGDDRPEFSGMPPIASNDPNLGTIWEQIAIVQVGSVEEKTDAAQMLGSLARGNERNCKLVIEEGGVQPLLKLLKGDFVAGQEAAANALGMLARDAQRVEDILEAVVPVFVQVLNNGSMKVQAKVAWALAQMVEQSKAAQDAFAGAGAILPLVALLAYETLEETKGQKKPHSIHSLVKASMEQNKVDGLPSVSKPEEAADMEGQKPSEEETKRTASPNGKPDPVGSEAQSQREYNSRKPSPWGAGAESGKPSVTFLKPALSVVPRTSGDYRTTSFDHRVSPENSRHGVQHSSTMRHITRQERDREDPGTKARLKAEAAHAIWKLAEKNVKNSKSITDTSALLCLAKLIESGEGDVQLNSVMAVMEIAGAAEQDAELRRAAFKTNSPAAKAVVDQLLIMIEAGEPDLQLPCIKAIGSLARIFPAPAMHVLRPLTAQLGNNRDGAIATEAAIALQKFANQHNYLHLEHSRTILDFSGAGHLVQLLYFGDPTVQQQALILLSYLALNVGDSDALEKADSLKALESATRWPNLVEDVKLLLFDAVQHLEHYQARSRGLRKGAPFMT